MDVLTDVLNMLELKGWLSSRQQLSPPWRYDFISSGDSIFHVFNYGSAYLHIKGEAEPIQIDDGDIVLFPNGDAHSIYDDPSSQMIQLVQLDYDAQQEHYIFEKGEEAKPLILCGAFHFEYPNDFPLLYRLPKLIHIRAKQGRTDQHLSDIVSLIARESASRAIGAGLMLRRLTELLFIQVIRLWIAQQADTSTGWGNALADQSISTALSLIHQSPEHKWTTKELAAEVALSRSAFSVRFRDLVGEPPMTYLTRWRMLRATRLLRNGMSVNAIAKMLGYSSEIAFRKAFKREIGIPPAQYRKSG